jgi:molybdenum cofactor cytidylyltransferase
VSTGILLAAGRGRRFGGEKLLARLPDGRRVAEAAAAAMVEALPHVVAVVRPGADEVARVLAAAGCEVTICPEADRGMGASLACGVRAAAGADAWIVALADMPWIRAATIAHVARLLAGGARIAAPVHAGRRGHPVGFGQEFGEALASLGSDRGARDLLAHHGGALVSFHTDDGGVIADIDRRQDIEDSPAR